MIILEGPDGSGKSTLAKRIAEEHGLTIEPRAVSKNAKSLVPIGEYIDQELHKGFGMRLYDRFALISSPAYAMLPNRTFVEPMTDLDWLKAAHHKFLKINPIIILCLPSLETVLGNTRLGVHDGLDLTAQIETIYINYLNFAATQVHNTSCMIWDYHKPHEVRLTYLMNWAKARVDHGR